MTRNHKLCGSLALLVLAALLLWLLRAAPPRDALLDERHVPRAWDEPFDFAAADFAAYQQWAERQLRAGLQQDTLPRALAPYRLEPGADCPVPADRPWHNGIVLLHDVQESPYQWWTLAQWLQQRCFVVLVPLLPGHGSVPGDLRRSDWQDWRAVQALALRELAGKVNNLFLGGHGAGATLALLGAAEQPQVKALLLVAPVLTPRPLPLTARLTDWLGPLSPPTRWAEVFPDLTPYRHDSRPWRLARQVNALLDATRPVLAAAGAGRPLFAVASGDDAEAPAEPILAFMRTLQHPDNRTLLYTRAPLPEQAGLTQVSTRRPELGLQGLGHEALLVGLGDPVFGQQGSYHDCRHYHRVDQERWERCDRGEYELLGEPGADTLAGGVLRKPAFNVLHAQLLQELELFLAPVLPRAAAIQLF